MNDRLKQIRESEKKSHIEVYSNEELYNTESWLKKPIKTIYELIPIFKENKELKVLDLGCGVGRNCIPIACEYKAIDCTIEGVDILELAIEKLHTNATKYGVASNIHGIVKPIEDYVIRKNEYNLIIAVSALEHIDTVDSFYNKLMEIKDGICENGVVCLVINSNVSEVNKATGKQLPAQFEVNLPTEDLQSMLNKTFTGWTVIKSTVQKQQYDIPRESGDCSINTSVISFVAQKCGGN